jgi:general secretion pathway protein D
MGALLAILLLLPQEKPEARRGGFLDDVNLHDLTMHVQKVTKKTILWSEELGLRGKRTHYVTDRPIGDDPVLLFKAYQHILQWNDLVLVRADKENEEVYKITTLGAGLKKSIPLVREAADPSERFITRVFTLQNASPRAIWQTLAPMVSIAQNILPVEESGALIITDYESNLRRLEEILKIVDVKKPDLEMKVLPLKHAAAQKVEEKMKSLVQTLITRSSGTRGVPVGPTGGEPATVSSDERTNSIILLAEPGRLAQLEDIARRLDAETPFESSGIHFAMLRHRNAIDVARTLTTLYRGGTIDERQTGLNVPSRTGPQAAPPPTATLVPTNPSAEPIIVPDIATNSLLIITDRSTFRTLEPIIRRLDRRRPQVFIKATIAEISARSDFDLGVELSHLEDPKGRFVVGARTSFGLTGLNADPANNVFTLTPVISPGATLLGMKDRVGNIPFILHALEGKAKITVVAEPEAATSDHSSAMMTATTEVPIAQTNFVGNTNGFTQASFHYEQATTTLTISPHISESGYLRLETNVKIQSFIPATDPSAPPGRTSRELTTKEVLVPSGGTVVLGGIVTGEDSTKVQGVPFLSQIPLIGPLFRREQETKERRTIYIFITATILYDEAFGDFADLTRERKEGMERLRGAPLDGLQVGPPSPQLPESTFRFMSVRGSRR